MEYSEVKQTAEERKVNTDSKPGDTSSIITMIASHEINFHEINSHIINSYKSNFSRNQLLGDQLS